MGFSRLENITTEHIISFFSVTGNFLGTGQFWRNFPQRRKKLPAESSMQIQTNI